MNRKEILERFRIVEQSYNSTLEEIRNPLFKKSEIDINYGDFKNWERGGLLYKEMVSDDGKQYRMCYLEYVWIRIVEKLRLFGMEYEEINKVKRLLVLDTIEDHDLNYLEVLVLLQIQSESKVKLYFYKPSLLEEPTIESLMDVAFEGEDNNYLKDHISLSLYSIVEQFYNKDGFKVILNRAEHRMLTVLRNYKSKLEFVLIEQSGGLEIVLNLLDSKLVELEAILFELYRRDIWSRMIIQYKNGKEEVYHNDI